MICPACSQNIPDGSNYCPVCAADLTKYRRQIAAANQAQSKRAMQQPPAQGGYGMPTGQGQPEYQGQQGQGYGGMFEGMTMRAKLIFGVAAFALLTVMIVLLVNLFSGGSKDPNTANNDPQTQPTVSAPPQSTMLNVFGSSTIEPTAIPMESLRITPSPEPVKATVPPFTRVLSKGLTGDDVRMVQEQLTALEFYSGPIDSQYGPDTVTAVKSFQKAVGLTNDGYTGEMTWNQLFSIPIAADPVVVPQNNPGGGSSGDGQPG